MTNGELIIYLSATAHIQPRNVLFIYVVVVNSFMSSQKYPPSDEAAVLLCNPERGFKVEN